jgi:hypothetical protein
LVTLLFEESSSEHNSRRPAPAPLARVPGTEGGTNHSARPWKDCAVTHLKWAVILHQSRPGVQFFRFCYYPKSQEEENAFPAGTPCDANRVRFPAGDSPFSGTWKFNPAEGHPLPPLPQSIVAQVEADEQNFKFSEEIVDEKDQTSELSYDAEIDGKDYPVTG